jgi:decaprenylphospho-beta-D-ribofuranose 2-oxidase
MRTLLAGWGGTSPSAAEVRRVESPADAAAVLATANGRGAIARGLGRSYGDVAQNAGGLVLDMTGLRELTSFDRDTGVVTVEAGCSLDALVQAVLPDGWFAPVSPGTRFVTVGGAIACDVHGKNHHRDGAFGKHVRSLTLLTTTGEVRVLDPDSTPDEFAATLGGLGLTGVVLDATLQLIPVETSLMRVDVERTTNFDDALARLESTDHLYRYSVAWVDCLARGSRFGRSLLMRGDHASLADLPENRRARAIELLPRPRVRVPRVASAGAVLRSAAPIAFNELHFRRARETEGDLQSLAEFFYPLDGIGDWNRLYGRAGFLQYQFVVPFERDDALRAVLGLVRGSQPLLVVLKRFGPEAGPLSFPVPGWTVALDFALPAPELGTVLDRADELVAAAGGRVYLAKDSRMRPERLAEMYPRLDEWRAVQARLDPEGRMACDLARRLGVTHGVRA